MKTQLILTAALLCILSPNAFAKPLKVFILAGQSNMEGQGVVSMDGERDYNGGKGNLVWSMKNSKSTEKMKCLKNEKGEWVVRDDVQISFKVGDKVWISSIGCAGDNTTEQRGKLSAGFGALS